MRSNIDPDVFLSEVVQLRDELNAVNKRPGLGLEKIIGMMKKPVLNHSQTSSVPKRSQESHRKVRRTDNARESAITLTSHNCKKPGHKRNIARS